MTKKQNKINRFMKELYSGEFKLQFGGVDLYDIIKEIMKTVGGK